MRDALLVFLGRDGGIGHWLRLEAGVVAARGEGLDALATERGVPVVAIAPGEQVTLRWMDLPAGLSAAQAAGAARLMAGEQVAQGAEELHVAAGTENGDGRCIGFVAAEAMRRWLAALAAEGLDPELVVPETLLLPRPQEAVAVREADGLGCYRGAAEAFAAEPEWGALLLGGRPWHSVDEAGFEAGLAGALGEAPLDLRQGAFARRRDWRVAPARLRRLALLAAALLLVSLAVEVAAIARYSFAADEAEAETRRVAAAALPRSPGMADPAAALDRRLAELRGGGAGFTATAAALFEAVKATPNVELAAIAFTPDGTLRATAQADSPAAIEALQRRVEGAGFAVEAGVPRSGGGRRVADLMVRPR